MPEPSICVNCRHHRGPTDEFDRSLHYCDHPSAERRQRVVDHISGLGCFTRSDGSLTLEGRPRCDEVNVRGTCRYWEAKVSEEGA